MFFPCFHESVVLVDLVQLSFDGILPHGFVIEPIKPHGIIVVPWDFNAKLDLGLVAGLGCIDLLHPSDELLAFVNKSLVNYPSSFIHQLVLLSILGNSDGVLASNPCQWLPGLLTSSPLNQDLICTSLFLPMIKNGFKAPSMVIVIFTDLVFNKV